MTPAGTTTVVVTRAGDRIRITPPRIPHGLLSSSLALPGGQLVFDVSDHGAPPWVEVTDAAAAAPWIVRVFGDEALDTVRDHDREDADEATESRIAVAPSEEGSRLARIAYGQWLWRYWPDSAEVGPLNTGLLRIELAALAWQADDSFGALQPAGVFLKGQLDTLEEAATALRASLATDPSAVQTPLGQAVLGAVDALVVGEAAIAAEAPPELLERLDAVLDEVAAAESDALTIEGPEPHAAGLLAWATGIRRRDAAARREHFALAASSADDHSGPDEVAGHDSVDWTQVPPRTLDWHEGTVAWVAEPSTAGGWTLSVRVVAAGDSESNDLYARCYLPDGSSTSLLPVLVMPLIPGFGDYLGEGTLPAGDLSTLVVDVYSGSAAHGPQVTDHGRTAQAEERDRARALIRRRAESPPTEGPAAPFEAERPPQ